MEELRMKFLQNRMHSFSLLVATVFFCLVGGCAGSRHAVPMELVPEAEVAGMPGVRAGVLHNPLFQKNLLESSRGQVDIFPDNLNSGQQTEKLRFQQKLTLSLNGHE